MIHPSAIVDSHAEIESGVEIGPFCVIGPHVKIRKGTEIMSHVRIEGHTSIGENNQIFPFTVIGAVPQDLKYNGEPTRVFIGDRNKIRESVTINLGTVQGGGETRVGNDNLLMAYVHIGHDSIVNNHCILSNGVGLAGHVVLDDYATLNGQTGVSQFVRVGKYAYVGGQSGLERDIPPFVIAHGSRPCSIKGANIVGLRRRGFSADTITRINESIKLWVRGDVQKEQCILDIELQFGDTPEIQDLVSFIRNSKTGVQR